MSYTEEFCRRVWEKDDAHVSQEGRLKNNLKWLQYWDYLAQKNPDPGESSAGFPAQIIAYLKQEEVISEASTVLDIGSGSGAFALPLARNCAEVTAVDMSAESLRLLESRALAEHLPVKTVCTMWENFSCRSRFDVVFSSLCPAVCDPGSLAAMESCSREHCVLLTVGKGSFSLIRKTISAGLAKEALPGLAPDVIYIFNYLYSQGKHPNLKFYPQTSRPQISLEEAYERYLVYFGIFGYTDKLSKNLIYRTLAQFVQKGVCTDCVTVNYALLYWQIRQGKD